MNSNFIIIVSGIVKDFDGYSSSCEYDVPCNPNDTGKIFILKFFQISCLNPCEYKLYYKKDNLEKFSVNTLAQIGLKNNSVIDLAYIELESLQVSKEAIPKNYRINIKFIKSRNQSVFNCYQELNGILKLCLLNEIALKIDDSILDKAFSLKNIPQKIYFILKILKKTNSLDENADDKKKIESILNLEKGKNIMNFSNFADEIINQEWINKIMNYVKQEDKNEINDTILKLGKYKFYMEFFEKELNKSMKQSYFEFSPVSLVIIDREDYDNYENERRNCPNRCEQILYHGTQVHPISSILTGMFKRSEKAHFQFGKGVYFTDLLDYCWFYGGNVDNRANKNKIPKIGDIFTAICSMVYYKRDGFLQVKDYKTRLIPGKNEINFAYAGAELETIDKPDKTKFLATEYVVWNLAQICPIISVKFRRDEFCIVWRDDNFSEEAIYNNDFDKMFKNFLGECIKYIKQSAKYNVYPCQTTNEALDIIRRKKYNKIILISNVGPQFGGKTFVEEARKIIGNDVIVMFLAYMQQHLKWITKFKNALFANKAEFYEEYLDCFGNKARMNQLIEKIQNHYQVKFNFDNKFMDYPLYKDSGKYSDLSF